MTFSPIAAEVARIQGTLRPSWAHDGRTYEVGAAHVYPVPIPLREDVPPNSWVNRWSLADPPEYEPGLSVTELWLLEMVWYGRSITVQYDLAYREAGAVLDACLAELYRSEHASLGGLVDTHRFGATTNVIDAEPELARTPIIVRLNLEITRTADYQ